MKVQAQRKFAQASLHGLGSRCSHNASSTKSSRTPKEKDKTLSSSCTNSPTTVATQDEYKDAFPGCCPKTEDFLAFLCFRGSSLLPPMEVLGLVPRSQPKESTETSDSKISHESPLTLTSKVSVPEPKISEALKKEIPTPTPNILVVAKQEYEKTNSTPKVQQISPKSIRPPVARSHSAFASRMLTRLSTRVLSWSMARIKMRSVRPASLKSPIKLERKTKSTSRISQESNRSSPRNRVTSLKESSEEKVGMTTRKGTQLKPPASAILNVTPKTENCKADKKKPRLRRHLSRKTKEVATVCLSLMGNEDDDGDEEVESNETDECSSEEETLTPRPTRRSTLLQRIASRSVPSLPVKKKNEIFDKSREESETEMRSKEPEFSLGVKTRRKAVQEEPLGRKFHSKPVTRSKSSQSVFSIGKSGKKQPELTQLRDKLIQAAKMTLQTPVEVTTEVESKRETRTSKKRNLETTESSEAIVPKNRRLAESRVKESTPVSQKSWNGPSSHVLKPLDPAPVSSNFNSKDVREAPVFKPTEAEWADPLTYLRRIRAEAEPFGICRIIPPSSFRPDCNLQEDLRFTGYRHYIHRTWRRWGPNSRTLAALRKHLRSLKIDCTHLPSLGGVEVDLPQLYHAVEAQGGITQVLERGRWAKVGELLGVPSVPGVNTRLDSVYVKYILPYAALSEADRRQLLTQVDKKYQERELRRRKNQEELNKTITDSEEESSEDSDSDSDECIVKDKSITLSSFYRTACHVYSALCPAEAKNNSTLLLEKLYWQFVEGGHRHISVLGGSIDTGLTGDYGFPSAKIENHPWNLKVLSSGQQSLLKAMGALMGVTLPTLHLNMLFSTCCWYRDPHGLPWIEYLHTGVDKVWYGVGAEQAIVFRDALKKLTPDLIREKSVWLPSDTVMVPPHVLKQEGVNVCRTVQEPGQFMVIWPRAFISSVGMGYSVSESVYFAPLDWLDSAQQLFEEAKLSCEPTVFSLDRLVVNLAQDGRTSAKIWTKIKPLLVVLVSSECKGRQALRKLGVGRWERVTWAKNKVGKGRKTSVGTAPEMDEEWECDSCRKNLFLSRVLDHEDNSFCLEHGLAVVRKAGTVAARKFAVNYSYTEEELQDLQQSAGTARYNK